MDFKFHIGISFAGEDRGIAEQVVNELKKYRLEIFYDMDNQADFIGKNLYVTLKDIFSRKCEYCIVLASKNYNEKLWTNVELKAIQEREFSDKTEYIIPMLLDESAIPGIEKTIGYIDLKTISIEDAAFLIAKKIYKVKYNKDINTLNIEKEYIEFFRTNGTTGFIDHFYKQLLVCRGGDIKICSITGNSLLRDKKFKIILELLNDKMKQLQTSITFRFYMLDPNCDQLSEYAKKSDERTSSIIEKANDSIEIINKLFKKNDIKSKIRTRLYLYRTMPIITFFQVNSFYYYRILHIGTKQEEFNTYITSKNTETAYLIENITYNLSKNSKEADINWF